MLSRAKELLVQKANGTYSTKDIDNINAEINSLGEEIANVIGNTQFNGMNVFTTPVDIAISHDGSVKLGIGAALNGTDGTGQLASIIKFTAGTPAKIENVFVADNLGGTTDTTVTNVETMIDAVNTQRATYGSQQNRLEHTINNLGTTSENLVAAESRIRDVDMAKEMMEMTKNNILSQAAQAMIAQANQQPQNILQLLR